MKVVIAGSRDLYPTIEEVEGAVKASGFGVTEVVHGDYRGVDTAAKAWGLSKGLKVTPFPAEWKKYGGRAGPIRNGKMAVYGNALIAFPGGNGTDDMIRKMKEQGKPVFLWKRS